MGPTKSFELKGDSSYRDPSYRELIALEGHAWASIEGYIMRRMGMVYPP